ncbi:MAG: tetratricopeptide repeat protein, partial [Planctomycetes bacterium]|nr:tetratricopeptide repeat protein [Planctomycetota bacterium]
SWIKPDLKIRPVRTLRQALLQGRLFEELSLNQELSSGWEFQKPRFHESWGGWWIRLKNRNCQLLLVPNGESKTIRALINSRWQPMSVDASVLPFGWSGEILSSPIIVKLLPVKDFLNHGQWIYSLPSPSGTPECSDWWGILTGDPNIKSALLQAKTFRAMKLYTAALRVLRPLLQDYHTPEVMREFHLCQQELAYQEKLDTGNPSELRLLTLNKTAEEYDRALEMTGPIISKPVKSQQLPDTFESAIQSYARGDWEAALNLLSTADSETLYAKARILLESGDPESAAALLQQLIQQHPDDRLVVPSQTLLESIQ